MAKEWPDVSCKENNLKRNNGNGNRNSLTVVTNSPPRKYSGNGNNGNWRVPFHGQSRPSTAPFIQRQIPGNYTFQPRKPFFPRKYPLTTNYSRNYKQEVERQNRLLPAFTFNHQKYRPNSADIQGYRDPKYFHHNKFKKYTKPNDVQIDEINLTVSPPESINSNSEFSNESSNLSSLSDQCTIFDPIPVNEEVDVVHCDRLKTSHFQIKIINSYKEFSRIKSKSLINLTSNYETISFLKALLPDPKQPIILFFDKNDRVFYGAAVVCLDEFLEREELDTSTIESLSLKINWIFLSEVEETDLNFNVNISEPLSPQEGLEVLKLMEEFETRLHDVKKIKPVKLKLKSSRLDELEDFFRITEGNTMPKDDVHLLDYSILEQVDTSLLAHNMAEISEMMSMQNKITEIINNQTFSLAETMLCDVTEVMDMQKRDVMNMEETITDAPIISDIEIITPITFTDNSAADDDFFDDYF